MIIYMVRAVHLFNKYMNILQIYQNYYNSKGFNWVHYREPTDPNKELLGRWIESAYLVGQGMAYNVLKKKKSY